MGTLSKALGGLGGFIAGSRAVVDLVINRGRPFIYSTAIPPSQAAAALAALEVVREEPERRAHLREMSGRLRERLKGVGFDVGQSASQIVPVMVGDAGRAVAISGALWDRGIFVPVIRPPSVPRGSSRLRVRQTSGHTEEHIERLAAALGGIMSGGARAGLGSGPEGRGRVADLLGADRAVGQLSWRGVRRIRRF